MLVKLVGAYANQAHYVSYGTPLLRLKRKNIYQACPIHASHIGYDKLRAKYMSWHKLSGRGDTNKYEHVYHNLRLCMLN